MNFYNPKNYFVYILTNKMRTVLYIGVTNNLKERLRQHLVSRDEKRFTTKYKVYFLIYYEVFDKPSIAIDRETQLKKWNRSKKERLINGFNKDWDFLNEKV